MKWRYILKEIEIKTGERNVNLFVLKLFFLKPYEAGDFYPQFQERMVMARDVLEL